MKRLLLAYNPVSGKAAFKKKLDYVIESFQKRGVMLQIYRTEKDKGHFLDFVRESAAEGIIAAGGDGTLHGVVNLLLKAKINLPVGIIGSGTSNDFASYLGINKNLEEYFDNIVAGKTRPVDVGRVFDEYFINVASAGMMTAIAHDVDFRVKNTLGRFAYYLNGLKEIPKLKSMPLTVVADGKKHELDAFLFVILNSGVVGSMKNVAAKAKIDDGKLDFLAMKKTTAAELMKTTADLIAGKPVDDAPNILHIAAEKFTVAAPGNIVSDLDGEKGPILPIEAVAVRRALDVYC